MYGYLIKCGTKRYATNANNVEEAEDKFIQQYGIETQKCEFVKFDVGDEMPTSQDIEFF